MKMKKIVTILLAAIMVLSLSACAGGNEPAGNSGNAASSQSSSEEPKTPEDSQESNASETLYSFYDEPVKISANVV